MFLDLSQIVPDSNVSYFLFLLGYVLRYQVKGDDNRLLCTSQITYLLFYQELFFSSP